MKINDIEKKVFNIFKNHEIYLCGGAVRDKLLSRNTKDYDFTTQLRPNDIIKVLNEHGYEAKEVGAKFGTIITNIDGYDIEISTFRKHEEYNGEDRFPKVVFGDCLREDLERRDFTMNAMAMNRKGNLIDYFNGQYDIKRKRIAVINNDKKDMIFRDDPLRMLRAIRFISQLGFSLGFYIRNVIPIETHLLKNISHERWKMEMNKILCGEYVAFALYKFLKMGIHHIILPELETINNLKQPKEHHRYDVLSHSNEAVKYVKNDVNLKWAMLLHDLGKANTISMDENNCLHFYKHEKYSQKIAERILDRFKFSNKDKEQILLLIENHMRIIHYDNEWSDKAIRKLKKDMGDYLDDLIEVSIADTKATGIDKQIQKTLNKINKLKDRMNTLKEIKSFETKLPSGIGTYIMDEFELKQGKIIGEIKNFLEKLMIEGVLESNKNYDYYHYAIEQYLNTREEFD